MGYGITIRVSGDYALFTRPEMKVEIEVTAFKG